MNANLNVCKPWRVDAWMTTSEITSKHFFASREDALEFYIHFSEQHRGSPWRVDNPFHDADGGLEHEKICLRYCIQQEEKARRERNS